MSHLGVIAAMIVGVTVATVLYFIFDNTEQQATRQTYYSTPPYTRSDDCPICLSTLNSAPKHVMQCCRNSLHLHCIQECERRTLGRQAVCPFCRAPFNILKKI